MAYQQYKYFLNIVFFFNDRHGEEQVKQKDYLKVDNQTPLGKLL